VRGQGLWSVSLPSMGRDAHATLAGFVLLGVVVFIVFVEDGLEPGGGGEVERGGEHGLGPMTKFE
jgi:hypothetical protein